MKEKIKAYKAILDVLTANEDHLEHDIDVRYSLRNRIACLEISKEFGIEVDPDRHGNASSYLQLTDYQFILTMGSKYNRTIFWSNDGRQPEDERLYKICFPTGAYIFGREYPQKTFKAFFDELKAYKPKYCDTANKSLYFTADKAAQVHKVFNETMDSYRALADEEVKQKKIDKMKAELEKLESEV